jgi:hypothetical protein
MVRQRRPRFFFAGQRIRLFLGDPEIDRDVCAGEGQRKCHGSPNASAGTGNQGNFAEKLSCVHGSKNTLDLANETIREETFRLLKILAGRTFFLFYCASLENW